MFFMFSINIITYYNRHCYYYMAGHLCLFLMLGLLHFSFLRTLSLK